MLFILFNIAFIIYSKTALGQTGGQNSKKLFVLPAFFAKRPLQNYCTVSGSACRARPAELGLQSSACRARPAASPRAEAGGFGACRYCRPLPAELGLQSSVGLPRVCRARPATLRSYPPAEDTSAWPTLSSRSSWCWENLDLGSSRLMTSPGNTRYAASYRNWCHLFPS